MPPLNFAAPGRGPVCKALESPLVWITIVVKAPKSEGVVDPKSGERRGEFLFLLSGSRGRKGAPKGDSSRCVWRKRTAMSVRDNI
ncbi:hypothetical protein TNCV_1237621 [Trichonephila clavipes]|nr:hypothetical protein TNCV_1237621 [Trichonephila clavipes]